MLVEGSALVASYCSRENNSETHNTSGAIVVVVVVGAAVNGGRELLKFACHRRRQGPTS